MKKDRSGTVEFDDPTTDKTEDAALPYPQEDLGVHMPRSEIERVMQKHEQQLLSIDGVEGVAIGTNEIGDDVIIIHLRDETVQRHIPRELDGIPVEVEITGQFDAL